MKQEDMDEESLPIIDHKKRKPLALQGTILSGVVRRNSREPTIAPFTHLGTIVLHLH
jgi:hypothetical protein